MKQGNTSSSTKTQYFEQACQWADDRLGYIEASRHRYRLAFFGAITLCTTLATAIAVMMPLKQLEPVMIHHYASGVTVAERLNQRLPEPTKAQIESDLVRYVIQRESFDVTSYRAQFELIHLLSSNHVAAEYDAEQRASNPNSPLKQLGTHMLRNVHVFDVIHIDEERLNAEEGKGRRRNHYDLAEVVFYTLDKNKSTGAETTQHFTALIAWRYTGMPASPDERWKNWNGFEVTRYTVQQRNVK